MRRAYRMRRDRRRERLASTGGAWRHRRDLRRRHRHHPLRHARLRSGKALRTRVSAGNATPARRHDPAQSRGVLVRRYRARGLRAHDRTRRSGRTLSEERHEGVVASLSQARIGPTSIESRSLGFFDEPYPSLAGVPMLLHAQADAQARARFLSALTSALLVEARPPWITAYVPSLYLWWGETPSVMRATTRSILPPTRDAPRRRRPYWIPRRVSSSIPSSDCVRRDEAPKTQRSPPRSTNTPSRSYCGPMPWAATGP